MVEDLCFLTFVIDPMNDDAARIQHRCRGMEHIRMLPCYGYHVGVGTAIAMEMLIADPHDLNISKRQWERMIQRWRHALENNVTSGVAGPLPEVIPLPVSLSISL